jgi:hypothetical protein
MTWLTSSGRFFPLPGVLDGQPVVRSVIEIFRVLEDHERQDHLLERISSIGDAVWIEMRRPGSTWVPYCPTIAKKVARKPSFSIV